MIFLNDLIIRDRQSILLLESLSYLVNSYLCLMYMHGKTFVAGGNTLI